MDCISFLSDQEKELFFKLRYDLLLAANKKLHIVEDIKTVVDLRECSWDELRLIRDSLVNTKNEAIYDELLQEKKDDYSEIECKIIQDWKKKVPEKYFIVKHLKNYSVFLEEKAEPRLYGVIGISEPLSEVTTRIALKLPVYTKTLLLPFKNKIIYDGVLEPYKIFFGPDVSH